MKRYRKTERGGRQFSAIEHEQAVAAKTTGILKLHDVIPWESFRLLLEDLTGYAARDWTKGGKPPLRPRAHVSKSSCCKIFTASVTTPPRSKSSTAPALKPSSDCASAHDIPDAKDQAVLADCAYHNAEHEEVWMFWIMARSCRGFWCRG